MWVFYMCTLSVSMRELETLILILQTTKFIALGWKHRLRFQVWCVNLPSRIPMQILKFTNKYVITATRRILVSKEWEWSRTCFPQVGHNKVLNEKKLIIWTLHISFTGGLRCWRKSVHKSLSISKKLTILAVIGSMSCIFSKNSSTLHITSGSNILPMKLYTCAKSGTTAS